MPRKKSFENFLSELTTKELFAELSRLVSIPQNRLQHTFHPEFSAEPQFFSLRKVLSHILTNKQDKFNIRSLLTEPSVNKENLIKGLSMVVGASSTPSEHSEVLKQFNDNFRALNYKGMPVVEIENAWVDRKFPFQSFASSASSSSSAPLLLEALNEPTVQPAYLLPTPMRHVDLPMLPEPKKAFLAKFKSIAKTSKNGAINAGEFIIDHRHAICWTVYATLPYNATKTFTKFACSYEWYGQMPWFAGKFAVQFAKTGYVLPALHSTIFTEVAIYRSTREDYETPTFVAAILFPMFGSSLYFTLRNGPKEVVKVIVSNTKYFVVGGRAPHRSIVNIIKDPLFIPSWKGLVLHSIGYTLPVFMKDDFDTDESSTRDLFILGGSLVIGAAIALFAAPVYTLWAIPGIALWSCIYTLDAIPFVRVGVAFYDNWFNGAVSADQDVSDILKTPSPLRSHYMSQAGALTPVLLQADTKEAIYALDQMEIDSDVRALGKSLIFVRNGDYEEVKLEIEKISPKYQNDPLIKYLNGKIQEAENPQAIRYDFDIIRKLVKQDNFQGFVDLLDREPELISKEIEYTSNEKLKRCGLLTCLMFTMEHDARLDKYIDYLIAKNTSIGSIRFRACAVGRLSRTHIKYLLYFKSKVDNATFDDCVKVHLERGLGETDALIFLIVEGMVSRSRMALINNNTNLLKRLLFLVEKENPVVDQDKYVRVIDSLKAIHPQDHVLKQLYELWVDSETFGTVAKKQPDKIKQYINDYETLLNTTPKEYEAHILCRIAFLQDRLHEMESNIKHANLAAFERACNAGSVMCCGMHMDGIRLYIDWFQKDVLAFTSSQIERVKATLIIQLIQEPFNLAYFTFAKKLYHFQHVHRQKFVLDQCIKLPQNLPIAQSYKPIAEQVAKIRHDVKLCAKPGTLSNLCNTLHTKNSDAVLCVLISQVQENLKTSFPYAKSVDWNISKNNTIVTKCGAPAAVIIAENAALSAQRVIFPEGFTTTTDIKFNDSGELCIEYKFPTTYIFPNGKPALLHNNVPPLCLGGMCEIGPDFLSYSVMSGAFKKSSFINKEINSLVGWIFSIIIGDRDHDHFNGFGLMCNDTDCIASRYYIDEAFSPLRLLGIVRKSHITSSGVYNAVETNMMFEPIPAFRASTGDLSFIKFSHFQYPPESLYEIIRQASINVDNVPWTEAFVRFFSISIIAINKEIAAAFSKTSEIVPLDVLTDAYDFSVIRKMCANPITFIKNWLDKHSIEKRQYDVVGSDEVYKHPDVMYYCSSLDVVSENDILKGVSYIAQCMTAISYVKMLGLALCLTAAKDGETPIGNSFPDDITCHIFTSVDRDKCDIESIKDGSCPHTKILLSELQIAGGLPNYLKAHD